jgi:hypothetical protein
VNAGLGTIVFGALGYLLVYASVANHGRFATHPYLGLFVDAYTGKPVIRSAPGAASSSSDEQEAPTAAQPAAVLAGATITRGSTPVRNRLAVMV